MAEMMNSDHIERARCLAMNEDLPPVEAVPFRCPHCHHIIDGVYDTPAPHPGRRFRPRMMAQVRQDLGIRLPWFEKIAEVHPAGKMGVKSAMEAFERIVPADRAGLELAREMYRGAVRYAKQCAADPTIKVKWMQGWLLTERWRDGAIRQPTNQH